MVVALGSSTSSSSLIGSGSGGSNMSDSLADADVLRLAHASNHLPPWLREPEDEHYWRRVHELPWAVDLTVEMASGRQQTLRVDVMVETLPLSALRARTGSAAPALHSSSSLSSSSSSSSSLSSSSSSSSSSHADSFGAEAALDESLDRLVTVVTATVVDAYGEPRSLRIDAGSSLHATLRVGSAELSMNEVRSVG